MITQAQAVTNVNRLCQKVVVDGRRKWSLPKTAKQRRRIKRWAIKAGFLVKRFKTISFAGFLRNGRLPIE